MQNSKLKIYLVPRWAGTIHTDWYDWLTEIIQVKYNIEIIRLEMPGWQNPEIDSSLNFLLSNIKDLDEKTYFIGHSVGCQAILRFIDHKIKTDEQIQIGGFLFVSGWFEVDKPWITLKPWLNPKDIEFQKISNHINYKKVVLSDNDPFTSDYQKNKLAWEKLLNADVEIYPNELHFNRNIEENILKEVEKMILTAI